MITKVIEILVDNVFPPICILCNDRILSHGGVCFSCWNKLSFISDIYCRICGRELSFRANIDFICPTCIATPPHYDMARYILKYDDISKVLIHNLKYYDKTYIAKFSANLIYSRYKSLIEEYGVVTAVPMHFFKRILRMHNHAQTLAKELAKISGLPLQNLLKKSKWTASQTSLSRTQRQKNIIGSFSLYDPSCLEGKKVILIDDVMTTGATINYCSKLLKTCGVSKILVLCIASTCINS